MRSKSEFDFLVVQKPEAKCGKVDVRLTKRQLKFIKDNNISPTKIFELGLKVAGFK